MNGNKSEKEKDSSPQLAGFAPASRGTMKSSASGAQSTATAAPSASASSSDGNNSTINIDTANRITKKKAVTSKPAAATKKRSKSSSSSRKAIAAAGGSGGIDSNNTNNNADEATTIQPIDPSTMNSTSFQPMPLSQIQLRIKSLLDTLPSIFPEVPPDYINPGHHSSSSSSSLNNPNNSLLYPPIQAFASSLQTTIEQLNLLLSLVSSATYQWGVDRSGASQQNLSVMNSELLQCQEVISSVVSGRLSNVLCPAVDVLVGRVEIVNRGGNGNNGAGKMEENGSGGSKKRKLDSTTTAAAAAADSTTDRLLDTNATTSRNEQRINHYTRPLVDPSYVHLCHQIVARNGEMLRYTLATCIHTAQRVIGDYLKAMKKDVGHEASKGGYY